MRGPRGGGEVKSGCEERKLEDMFFVFVFVFFLDM